ncbi:TatD family deoxyribonuclease [Betaproteobacteria bacterium PRO7]|nr:TatD family deoxyribonuclease [Betaproteobacteria bacterium PRO7]
MLIDTHCHLDADEFDADRDAVVARARAAGVAMMVLPAAHVGHFAQTAEIARRYGCAYAFGIHPLWIDRSREDDIGALRAAVAAAIDDPRFVAVGEVGLDFYAPGLDTARQEWFYREQLKIARDFELPVILHVRRSQDALLKYLRLHPVAGGIAHAFNGSDDQAQRFLKAGFRLGFGGAMTYDGSLRIRRFAATLPDDAWVIETDAPDIPPQWLRQAGGTLRNEPAELARIAETMAQLRGVAIGEVAERNRRNACAALPRLARWLAAASGAAQGAEAH